LFNIKRYSTVSSIIQRVGSLRKKDKKFRRHIEIMGNLAINIVGLLGKTMLILQQRLTGVPKIFMWQFILLIKVNIH
jgi:hypothetical protein